MNNTRSKFSEKHNSKYLKGHATKPVKKYNSLNNAMGNAVNRNNVSGITLGKKYTLRKGKQLLNSSTKETSWLKKKSTKKPNSNNIESFASRFVKSLFSTNTKPTSKPKSKSKPQPEKPVPKDLLDRFNKRNNCYVKTHATKPVVYYNSLEEAMKAALENDKVSGITKSGKYNRYTLRKAKEFLESSKGETAWLKKKLYKSAEFVNSNNNVSNE